MTASGFQLARVQPLLGRPLIEDDEREGAEPVAVIGYGLWQSRFSSDPAVLGQRIQIGGTPHIVVGVMPEGFRFPVNQRLWTPLRTTEVRRRLHLCAPRSWRDAGTRAGRSHDVRFVAWRYRCRNDRTARAAGRGLCRRPVSRCSRQQLAGRCHLSAGRAPPDPSVREYRDPGVRADHHETGGVRRADGVGRQPGAHRHADLRRGARACGRGGNRRVPPGAGVQRPVDRDGHAHDRSREPAVLDELDAVVGNGPLRRGSQPACRRDCGCRAGVSCHRTMAAIGVFGLGTQVAGARLGKTWTALLATQVALSLAILPSAMELMWGIFRPTIVARIVGPGLPVEEFLTASLVMEGDSSRFEQPQSRSGETADVRGRHFRRDGVSGQAPGGTLRRYRGGGERGARC